MTDQHSHLHRLVEAREDDMNRDHMTHFQKLSGIRPTLPSLEEMDAPKMLAKLGKPVKVVQAGVMKIYVYKSNSPYNKFAAVVQSKSGGELPGLGGDTPDEAIAKTKALLKKSGAKIESLDEADKLGKPEVINGMKFGTRYKYNHGIFIDHVEDKGEFHVSQAGRPSKKLGFAKSLAKAKEIALKKGDFMESVGDLGEALGVPDLNKWKITQKGGTTFYTIKLHGKTVTVSEKGEPARSGLYRYRIFIDGKQYQKQDETEIKGVMRTVEKAVMGESIDLSEGAEEFRAAVSRIIPDPKEFRKLAKKYRVEIVLETHQAWNKKGGGIQFHVKLPDGKYKLYSPGGPGRGSYLETASSASNYGPEGLMVGWSPEAQAKWGKSEDVGDSDESEVTEAAGNYFVLVDVSKPGGRLVSKKLFQGLPGLKKADAVVEKLRAKGRDVQVIDAAWYAPADELVAAATKGEATEESEDVDDLDEGQPYDPEEDPRTYSDLDLYKFMDMVHSEDGIGGARKLGKAAYKKYAAAKREMTKRGLPKKMPPKSAFHRSYIQDKRLLDPNAPGGGIRAEDVGSAAIADGSALITEDIRSYRVLAGMDPLPSRR
jgi:hypothetical protein